MRFEYKEPRLEIIDLLETDIITNSGDNDFDFGNFGKKIAKTLGLNPDDLWSSNNDSWNSSGAWN